MKNLLLMGTALLSIVSYASAMNSDQKDSKINLSPRENITTSAPPPPPHFINNNNAPLPPVSESSASAVNNVTESENFDQLVDHALQIFNKLAEDKEDNKKSISPSDWNDGFMTILEILQNKNIKDILDMNIDRSKYIEFFNYKEKLLKASDTSKDEKHYLKLRNLDFALDRLYHTNHDNPYQGFESQAEEQIIQLYNLIHRNALLKKLFLEEREADIGFKKSPIINITKYLFNILIMQQRAQIDLNLASKLLRDQNISCANNYLQLETIAYLIATGKGSLDDLISSQKEDIVDENTLLENFNHILNLIERGEW